MTLRSAHYGLDVHGWKVNARESTAYFPADSLRDVGVSQVASGVRAEAEVHVSLGSLTLRPSGRWERERLGAGSSNQGSDGSEGFFRTSPTGASRTYAVGLQLTRHPWGTSVVYRDRWLDLESTLYRSGLSAGRLFYAELGLRQWLVEAHHHGGASRWSVTIAREHAEGKLSTRVETWPFLDLWGTLSVQAYRLGGSLGAQATWLKVHRSSSSAGGWELGAGVGSYTVGMDRTSWFVTSLGFGRTDSEATSAGVDPAVVLSVEIARSLTFAGSVVRLEGEAGLPVSARTVATAPPEATSEIGGMAGYATAAIVWSW